MTARTVVSSPVGPLALEAEDGRLTRLGFAAPGTGADRQPPAGGVVRRTREQLEAYFAGELEAFDVPLAPRGTPFQLAVWERLAAIPFGTTTTYGALAEGLGGHSACRAVGTANGANPIAVILPCHRVIGARGKLTGYGGGLPVKRWLLRHEGALLV